MFRSCNQEKRQISERGLKEDKQEVKPGIKVAYLKWERQLVVGKKQGTFRWVKINERH